VWLAAVVTIAGCDNARVAPAAKQTAAVPKPPAAENTMTAAPAEVKDDAVAAAQAAPAQASMPVDQSEVASVAPNTDAKGEAESHSENADEPAAPAAPERVAVLTPGGPLLLDVRFTVDGKPHSSSIASHVQRVLEAGDSNDDGKSTWKELVDDRDYLEKEMPKAPAADSRPMKELIERYDENRDGRIQEAEAAAWIGRDMGVSAKGFALRSTRTYRPVPRATSQVWHLVDTNRDGRLSREEISNSANRLLSMDADDDRVLAPAEMASLREQLASSGQQRMYVGRESSHYAALHLEPDTEFDRVHYLLSDLYSPQQDLGPTSFSELVTHFEKLDASEDDWFDHEELAALRTIEPHATVLVSFTNAEGKKAGKAAIEVKPLITEVATSPQPSPDRVVVSLGNTRLILSAHQFAAPSDEEQTSAQKVAREQVRLMVHDQADAVFEALDTNADGQLGEREIALAPQQFADRDRDGDGQLAGVEFPYAMIAAFMRGEDPSQRSFYVPTSYSPQYAPDQPLPDWFAHADLNGDGDVSRREFLGTPAHFDRLDTDHDSYVTAAEAASFTGK
jgi:Ca2+-binding EF-hand superfamily protein